MPHEVRHNSGAYAGDDGAAFWAHFAGEERTLALFCKLTPPAEWESLEPLGFTSHIEDVVLAAHDDLNFVSTEGLNPSAAESEGGKPSNVNIGAVFDSEFLTEADLLAGKWSGARFELWLMNWADLAMGEFVIQSGLLSEIKNYQTYFKSEVRGLSSLMETNFGELTSRTCRALQAKNGGFGGWQCKKTLTGDSPDGYQIKRTLTVAAVISRTEIHFTRIEDVPDTFYTNGKIVGITGGNEDLARQMQGAEGEGGLLVEVTLRLPFPLTVDVGDTFELTAGCDGTLERCVYWENVINRRAEDWITSVESVGKVPSG